jgi:hypothetical protein
MHVSGVIGRRFEKVKNSHRFEKVKNSHRFEKVKNSHRFEKVKNSRHASTLILTNKSAIDLRIWKGHQFEKTLKSDRDLR